MSARPSTYSVILHLMLIGLAVNAGLLSQQNRDLRQRLTPPPQKSAFETGSTLADLEVQDLEGQPATLSFAGSDRQSLVFFFTTTCGACRENQSRWRRLHDRLASAVDIVGVSLDGPAETRAYGESLELPFRTVSVLDPNALAQDLRLNLVPETVLVDGNGRVVRSWLGILSDDDLSFLGAGT